LAAIGILFFCVGGGRAGVDAAFSLARWRAKEAKRS
jgi:thioredoxin reductase